MAEENGTIFQRFLIILFGAGIVAIAGHEFGIKYLPKGKTQSLASSAKEMLHTFQGDASTSRGRLSDKALVADQKKPAKDAQVEPPKHDLDSDLDKSGLDNLIKKIAK